MKNIMQAIKFLVFLWIAFGSIQLQAQEKHFIYIQNENKQPFYVLLNKEVYSSTPGGYLIIPQLVAGKYDLATGFAKNKYPEQNFLVDLNRDAGFSLKQYGDKGWGLVDLQSFTTIMAGVKDTAAIGTNVQSVASTTNDKVIMTEPSKNDSLQVHDSATSTTTVNTGIVDQLSSIEIKKDSAVTTKSEKEISVNEVKKDTVTSVTSKETFINEVKNNPVTAVVIQKEASPVPSEAKIARRSSPSSIVRTFAKSGNRGFDMIYIDKSGFKHDTIALLIPRNEKISKITNPTVNAQELNVILDNKKAAKCVQATDEDFYKTRLHIAAATTENAMMVAARTAFMTKCFSTRQVKYLDVLFLSEGSRLRFLELAKPYVYDAGNFSSLQSQFTEPAMIQKFRALLKKK